VLELDFRGQQTTGTMGDLDGQGASQDPQVERMGRDRSEAEASPFFAVDPLPEPCVTAVLAAEIEGLWE
jgi:hypothetical protein